MKSEKGLTITSIMIYILVLTFIVIILARVSTFFYKNIKELNNNSDNGIQYTRLTTFITDEINTKQNGIESFGENYIKFSKTQNQYTFQNGCVYLNKAKICKNIKNCKFSYNEEDNTVYISIMINNKVYYNRYILSE